MATYSTADVIGKDLFAKVNINVRSNSTVNSTQLAKIKAGNRVGTVYSYVSGTDEKGQKDGSLWWMLEDKFGGKTGFVKHKVGWYDLKSLKEQGLQTQAEKDAEKEDEDKAWYEKLGEGVLANVKKLVIVGAVVYVVVKLGTVAIEKGGTKSQRALPAPNNT